MMTLTNLVCLTIHRIAMSATNTLKMGCLSQSAAAPTAMTHTARTPMIDKTEAKRLERAHNAAGNIYVKEWIPADRKPDVDAMAQEAADRVKGEK